MLTTKPYSVLIIDDDADIRKGIAALLQMEWPDMVLLEAANGAVGVEWAILKQPDLILLDGEMPIMTGHQMVMMFKMMPSVAHIPLLAITGADPENPIVAGMVDLCQAYLPKPFRAEALLETVRSLLKR